MPFSFFVVHMYKMKRIITWGLYHDICDLYEVRDQKRHKYHWPIAGAVLYQDTTRWNIRFKIWVSQYIHFWIYYDVSNNCILDLQIKISIRNAFTALLFWFLSFIPWDHAMFVKEHQRKMCNKRKMACVSVAQRKICRKWNQRLCQFYEFWVEWPLNSCKFQVCNNFFGFWKKILRDTRLNLLQTKSICVILWYFLKYKHKTQLHLLIIFVSKRG